MVKQRMIRLSQMNDSDEIFQGIRRDLHPGTVITRCICCKAGLRIFAGDQPICGRCAAIP